MPTTNVLKDIAASLEVLAAELKKISADPYFTRFAEESKFEEVAPPTEAQEQKQATPAVTLETLRHLLTSLTNNGKREQVRQMLTEIGGCKKLSEVPPEKYEALYNAAKEAE